MKTGDNNGIWSIDVYSILYTSFVVEVAAFDCTTQDEEDEEVCTDPSFPVFEKHPNTASIASVLRDLDDQNRYFHFGSQLSLSGCFWPTFELAHFCGPRGRKHASGESFRVVLCFSFVGAGQVCLCCVGDSVFDKYSSITVATDYSYFKKIIGHVFQVTGIAGASETITLKELKITMPLPAIIIGWPTDVECTVFEALISFVRNRPLVSTQSLSRPWHPAPWFIQQ